ncbi:DUF6160 family protein [Ectopseudomonas mendocina]|jgi:hypothetical protein|uniref:DUF6160 domain-containing protein n=1 Tax=Ectopseudomonas mendocina TaxID=300 RepID=A0A2R3QK94_ECTME|nr:DUF6160 family protein [Pseudomonas mendocina]AVO52160.1 hypothetical protein C7A17_05045 [Pseudomonas mendocina]
MTCARTAVALLSLLPVLALAEMQALDDSTLSEMSGQGGVYLSGEFSINKDGGVLWGTPATNNPAQWTANQRSCALAGAASPESCGMRVAVRSGANAGWYVLDNLKGIFSFEGLTLDTRTLTSATGEREVLALGLPNEIRFKDGNFSFGVASQGGWKNKALSAANGGDPSYQQTNIFSAKIDGSIRMQGSVLVFPTN